MTPTLPLTVAETEQLAAELGERHRCPPDRIKRAAVVAFTEAAPEQQAAYLALVRGWMGHRRPDGSDEPADVYWRRRLLDALPDGPPGLTRAQLAEVLHPGQGDGRLVSACARVLRGLVATGAVTCISCRGSIDGREPDLLHRADPPVTSRPVAGGT